MLERAAVEEETLVGRELAGYRLEEVIGRGGMGVVYRAEHLRLGRKVALKVVAPQIAREEKFRERFLRESRTAGSLDHPNVVPMYDAGEADGVLYIAMRFVDGVDLGTLLERDGPLEPARAARIVAQVASALDAAHEAGLVHRDVKPSNVLLPARGAGRGEHAYLGDFGLTKRVLSESGVTGSSAFLGTIAYVAPEQIEGRQIDGQADQYSLACLTYESLTGHKPFERETDIATLYAHIRDSFPSVGEAVPAELVPDIDAVLARAAAKLPGDRYQSAGDMAEDLVRAAGGAAPGTSPVPVVAAKPTRARGRRRVLIGAALAALAVAVIGGALVVQSLGPAGPLLAGHGVAAIDATTNLARAVTTLTEQPTAIAADATAAWVTHFGTETVSRIDAAGPHEVTEINVGAGPEAVVAADIGTEEDPEARVWVANVTGQSLSIIDAGQPDRAPSTQALLFRPGAMTYDSGMLWIIDAQADTVIAHTVFPRLEAIDDPVSVGAGAVALGAGAGAVWVASELDESVTRVQAVTQTADASIQLTFSPGPVALDVEGEALWIVNAADDALVELSTRSREEVDRVELAARPVAVAVGAGAVWVATASGTVIRIDPSTNEAMTPIEIGGVPVGIAVAGTTVWVAVAEP
jgi:DNA-binding beta-propeller fold protein YncE/tRNA A-37 threonylcarbamoyl transferase component Bud32